jgi:hypothetical protein
MRGVFQTISFSDHFTGAVTAAGATPVPSGPRIRGQLVWSAAKAAVAKSADVRKAKI